MQRFNAPAQEIELMRHLPRHTQGLIFATLGALALTPDGLLVRLAADNDWTTLFWRGLFSGVILFVLFLMQTGKDFLKNAFPSQKVEALSIFLASTGTIFFVLAINHTSVASALVILSTMPFFAALFSLLFLKEKVALRTWIAIVFAIIGICVVFLDGLNETTPLMGKIYALLCALVTAGNITLIRAHQGLNVLKVFAWSGLFTALPAFFFAPTLMVTAPSFGALALMGVLNAAAYIWIGAGSKRISPPEVTLLMLLETVLGPVWVFVFIGETPTSNALIGGAIVISTILVHTYATLRSKNQ